eukprot:3568357-Rhodomonas_salina.1
MACLYWLVKTVSSTEAEIQQFEIDNNLGPEPDVMHKYVLAGYFINAIYTTVGFGDVAGEVFCSLLSPTHPLACAHMCSRALARAHTPSHTRTYAHHHTLPYAGMR